MIILILALWFARNAARRNRQFSPGFSNRPTRTSHHAQAKPKTLYWAVIFTTKTTDNLEGYDSTSHTLEEILKDFDGYLGMDSSRNSEGIGITVSYWRDEESIKRWKMNESHSTARELGRQQWYEYYHLRVCQVVREYDWANN